MAVYINTLNGGNITIGASGGGGSSEHADTWYKYSGDTEWRTVSINGAIICNEEYAEATLQIPKATDIVELEIGTSVTSIGAYAFFGCDDLTSVTIPNSVTSIGSSAFYGCELTNLTIGNSVTSIGGEAFNSCNIVGTLIIPASVTSIGYDAFGTGNEGLTTITVLGKTTSAAQALLADANVPEGCTIVGELG